MMNCQKATRLLSDAQERKLSLQERATLKMHVIMCSACRNFAEQMDVLREMTRAYAKGTDSPSSDNSAEAGLGTSSNNDTNKDK